MNQKNSPKTTDEKVCKNRKFEGEMKMTERVHVTYEYKIKGSNIWQQAGFYTTAPITESMAKNQAMRQRANIEEVRIISIR